MESPSLSVTGTPTTRRLIPNDAEKPIMKDNEIIERANARRRVRDAAPELLDALVNIMVGIETGALRIETDQDETWANAMARANAAIALTEDPS